MAYVLDLFCGCEPMRLTQYEVIRMLSNSYEHRLYALEMRNSTILTKDCVQ